METTGELFRNRGGNYYREIVWKGNLDLEDDKNMSFALLFCRQCEYVIRVARLRMRTDNSLAVNHILSPVVLLKVHVFVSVVEVGTSRWRVLKARGLVSDSVQLPLMRTIKIPQNISLQHLKNDHYTVTILWCKVWTQENHFFTGCLCVIGLSLRCYDSKEK